MDAVAGLFFVFLLNVFYDVWGDCLDLDLKKSFWCSNGAAGSQPPQTLTIALQ